MDYTKRVKYISLIIPPLGVNRYKYYEFSIDDIDKKIIINGDIGKLEYSFEEIQKLFIPEVGNWDNLLVQKNKKVDNKINAKDKLKKYL